MSTSKIKASVMAAVVACAGLLAAPPSADACWLWTYATGGPDGGLVWGQAQTELDFGCYEQGYYDGVSAGVWLEGPVWFNADWSWGPWYAEVTVYLPAEPGWHWVEAVGYAPHYWSPSLDLVCYDYASFFVQPPPAPPPQLSLYLDAAPFSFTTGN